MFQDLFGLLKSSSPSSLIVDENKWKKLLFGFRGRESSSILLIVFTDTPIDNISIINMEKRNECRKTLEINIYINSPFPWLKDIEHNSCVPHRLKGLIQYWTNGFYKKSHLNHFFEIERQEIFSYLEVIREEVLLLRELKSNWGL